MLRKSPAQTDVRVELAAFKRERIVSAASMLFAQNGYDQTRLDTVAEQLGVTKPFIYSEFESKADLLAEICLSAVMRPLIATEEAIVADRPPLEKLADFIRAFVVAVCSHQTDVTVFAREQKSLAEPAREKLLEARHQLHNRLVSLLKEGCASGDMEVANPVITALTIQGAISWSYVWYRPDGKLSLPALAEQMASEMVKLVAPSQPRVAKIVTARKKRA